MYVCDTREKTNEHILKYFDRHTIQYKVEKVDTGDYMNTENPLVRVERKKSLGELAHNLLSPDKSRFYREVRRAREQGIQLVILCEHGGIKNLDDVKKWRNPYGKVTGKTLADAIFKLYIGYHIEVFFCDKRSTGRRICEILNGGVYNDK